VPFGYEHTVKTAGFGLLGFAYELVSEVGGFYGTGLWLLVRPTVCIE